MSAEGPPSQTRPAQRQRVGSDAPFLAGLCVIGGLYVSLIVAMVLADTAFTSPRHLWQALGSAEIRYAIKLSLISCSMAALFSLWVAVPLGYLMSRQQFPGKALVDAVLDIPIVLPPLVIGLSLLILFQVRLGSGTIEDFFTNQLRWPVTYA